MTTYNGWTNYETWCVALWMDGITDDWAKECYDEAENLEEAVDTLETRLEEWVEDENAPEVEGMYADLLRAALSEVNFHEIAKNALDEYEEKEQPAAEKEEQDGVPDTDRDVVVGRTDGSERKGWYSPRTHCWYVYSEDKPNNVVNAPEIDSDTVSYWKELTE